MSLSLQVCGAEQPWVGDRMCRCHRLPSHPGAHECEACGTTWQTDRPCPAVTTAVLNVDVPTPIHCGGLEGHEGPHRVLIEWTNVQEPTNGRSE